MSLTASSLRELHRLHRQQTDLKDRLTAGPRRVGAAEAAIMALQTAFDETKETYTKARMHADERQLQLHEREQRITDTQGKLNTCSTNREFQTLKDQIDADQQANNVLSDEILELLEKLDEHEQLVSDAQENVDKANQELEKMRQSVEAGRPELESELQRIQGELGTAEATLPSDLRADYDRMTSARGEDALAPVDGDVCGSCSQTLIPQSIDQLRMEKPVFCKSCGCLLYAAEGPKADSD